MTDSLPDVLAGRKLAVVDIEGNGQQPPEIVEIAVLPIEVPTTVRADAMRTWLIRPEHPIAGLVTVKVHGITNGEVAGCPPWTKVATDIRQVLEGRVLVVHHAHVERRVLAAHLPAWQPPMVLDTLRLAKNIWPGLDSYGLDALLEYSGMDTSEAAEQRRHRAGYDVWCTWQLLLTLLQQRTLTWARLVEFAALPGFAEPEPGLW
jgi:DNA polymerase III epsilon subunit-like protein